jgi:hypothetical protein
MNLEHLARRMASGAQATRDLTHGVPDEQARWRPDPESWSILEVVNHLYDEERLDFRVRLDRVLHHPGKPWSPIDPSRRLYGENALAT